MPRIALRVQSGKVDAQGLGHFVVLDDDQVLAREMLDRHILRLGLALQDLDGHLACSVAQVLIVDGEGEHAAGLASSTASFSPETACMIAETIGMFNVMAGVSPFLYLTSGVFRETFAGMQLQSEFPGMSRYSLKV